MVRKLVPGSWLLWGSVAGLLISVGCGSGSAPAPATTDNAPQASAESAESDHEHSEDAESESADGLSGLPAEDRALAEAQKVCPVGDGKLGDMGTPVKIEHEGKVVFLCCEHCREPFLEEPAKYLAKLEKAAETAKDTPTSEPAPAPTTP